MVTKYVSTYEKIFEYFNSLFMEHNLEIDKENLISRACINLGTPRKKIIEVLEEFKKADIITEKMGVFYVRKDSPEKTDPSLEEDFKKAGI